MDSGGRVWMRARGCEANACIEVAREGDLVLLRNSTYPDGPVLTATRQEWAVFADAVRQHEFGDGSSTQ
jgi:hypothetical protein